MALSPQYFGEQHSTGRESQPPAGQPSEQSSVRRTAANIAKDAAAGAALDAAHVACPYYANPLWGYNPKAGFMNA
jgi:hypothetical protein